jgi:hypothetical protein
MKTCLWEKGSIKWTTECKNAHLIKQVGPGEEDFLYCPYCGKLIEIDVQEDLLCPTCCGSGEGQFDGTTCRDCKGSGLQACKKQEEEDRKEEAGRFFKVELDDPEV